MRFKSSPAGGFQIFAVAGVNTVSFGIKATTAARRGLLGFGVERTDLTEDEKYVMPGFKVFESLIPHPTEETRVSTMDHPIQSLVWDDFTAKPDHEYEYAFQPLKGEPKNLDRTAARIRIKIRTEALYSNLESDIFFNRGVASSQAYVTRFDNRKPDQLPSAEEKAALQWLSRDLDDALLRFIASTKKGDALRCCFYEFRYIPALQELRRAIRRGVDVRIIVDGKVNEFTDKKGFHPSFPRKDNKDAIRQAGIPTKNVIFRQAKPNDIQHNKFMVRLKGANQVPSEVWTGSTNLSIGGIHGQTNVGHWLRNKAVAKRFFDYWTLLSKDPGARKGDDRSKARTRNDALKKDVEALQAVPGTIDEVTDGVTPVFSPRSGQTILDLYFDLVDSADRSAFITLAFGINATLKKKLENNTSDSHIIFLLLEKEDKPRKNSKTPFLAINSRNNVYKAWGSYLRDPLYQWARETNARSLEFNRHVVYIHSKFLLRDPLGDDPIVVTGSANFSAASTNSNDENMLIIRGDKRVADIYFTEFNRLFNHYYFRSVHEAASRRNPPAGSSDSSLFLAEDDGWTSKYAPGKLRQKRLDLYVNMSGFAS